MRLREEEDMAMVFVSHDLAVIARMADRVLVMYAGRVLEHGPAEEVIERPRHPYTRALVSAIPDFRAKGSSRLSIRYCLSAERSRPERSFRTLRRYS